MFYLKYRPHTLQELDNTHVRDQLTKILQAESIPHAFLFAGPKGTGKTSTARIVAKILNSTDNASGKIKNLSPSESEANVRAITQGTSPDVIEMDAASSRKIDDIRQLISELKFAPLVSQYKIYIIDEVHMLTKEAFNALLKSLEEPPPSTLFILATTETDSLPKTILSRCVMVNFVHADTQDVISMLKRISTGEKISLSDDALTSIAEHSGGSFRDAAKLLEMAVIQKATTPEAIQGLLGTSSQSVDSIDVFLTGSLSDSLTWIQHASTEGANFRSIIESMLHTLHKILLQKNGIDVELKTTYNVSIKEVAYLISLLQRAYNEMKYAPVHQLPLELVAVDFFTFKQSLETKSAIKN